VNPAAIGLNVPVAVGLVGDARRILERLLQFVTSRNCLPWREEIRGLQHAREELFTVACRPR